MKLNTSEILKSIVKNKDLVKYHEGWTSFIFINYPAVQEIGLLQKGDLLELAFYYGDTQSQARALFATGLNLNLLQSNNWYVRPNFHFSTSFRNFIYIDCKRDITEYIAFWNHHKELLYQRDKKGAVELVDTLSQNGLISEQAKTNAITKIKNSDVTVFNVCPGIGAIYSIDIKGFSNPQDNPQLKELLVKKISEGLNAIGEYRSDFLIQRGEPDGL